MNLMLRKYIFVVRSVEVLEPLVGPEVFYIFEGPVYFINNLRNPKDVT